jgi:hypothetical protein
MTVPSYARIAFCYHHIPDIAGQWHQARTRGGLNSRHYVCCASPDAVEWVISESRVTLFTS